MTPDEAILCLKRAATFFRSIAVHGGYVWWYSEDLRERWGERKAGEEEIWVQPPGTPSVGMAFLRAYEATGDPFYLEAAEDAANALAWGQLESGGWTYSIDFSSEWRRRWYRRADKGRLPPKEVSRRRNWTSFDDDTTQSALRFLMRLVKATGPPRDERDRRIREAMEYGLEGMLKAQYPNGAWPQGYDGRKHNPERHPKKRAWIPEEWPYRPPKGRRYWLYYTFNDGVIPNCILTLLEAYRLFGRDRFLEAAKRGGDFIILAQLPDPQPGWAQQYDFDMKPAWARRFEPPALSSYESALAIKALLELYLATGEERYLKPIPPAIEWLRRSRIGPDLWARFYELKTNRPIYFTRNYRLTYDDGDLPRHYSFKGSFGIPGLMRFYEKVVKLGWERMLAERNRRPSLSEKRRRCRSLEPRIRRIMSSMDEKGRWVRGGKVESRVFISNVGALCDYIEMCHAYAPGRRKGR